MRSPLKLSLGMGADKRAAKQRRARPLPLHSPRTYPSPSPRCLFISLSQSMCFQCVCASARAPLPARLYYLGSSQTESFTPGGSLVPLLCRTRSVYSHANIISMADDRGLGGMLRCAAKLQCHCLIPGMPRCAAHGWGKTGAPEGPWHPGEFTFTLAQSWFWMLKERSNRAGISHGTK